MNLIVTLLAQQLKRIGREAALQEVEMNKKINPHQLVQENISGLTRVQPSKLKKEEAGELGNKKLPGKSRDK